MIAFHLAVLADLSGVTDYGHMVGPFTKINSFLVVFKLVTGMVEL